MTRWTVLTWLLLGATGCGSNIFFKSPDPAVRYLAFGDSMTNGPAERSYPDFLRERLGAPVETFANEGESGESAALGVERLQMLMEDEIYPNASVFLYWQGGVEIIDFIDRTDPFLLFSPDDLDFPFNQSLTERLNAVQVSIEAAVQMALDAGMDTYVATYFALAPGVTECSALPFNIAVPEQTEHANIYIDRLNDRIRSAAETLGVTLVDVGSFSPTLQSDPDHYFNCNHLSESGNDIVAQIFATHVVPVSTDP